MSQVVTEQGPAPALASLTGWQLGRQICSYTERDAILFALAVGARATELQWVYEQQLSVMPTFALTLGLWAVRAAGATGAYDPVRTLHVGQQLRVRRSLPAAAEVEMDAHVAAVWDKRSAALVDIVVSSEFFDATYTIFVPGAGGFGGDRGPSRIAEDNAGAPEWRAEVNTTADQAALYRLAGDLHPVHIDPEVARATGLERPILHGLCTLASVTYAIAHEVGAELEALSTLAARLTAPVYPGDVIDTEIWAADGAFTFRARSGAAVVLDGGGVEF